MKRAFKKINVLLILIISGYQTLLATSSNIDTLTPAETCGYEIAVAFSMYNNLTYSEKCKVSYITSNVANGSITGAQAQNLVTPYPNILAYFSQLNNLQAILQANNYHTLLQSVIDKDKIIDKFGETIHGTERANVDCNTYRAHLRLLKAEALLCIDLVAVGCLTSTVAYPFCLAVGATACMMAYNFDVAHLDLDYPGCADAYVANPVPSNIPTQFNTCN